MLSIGEHLDRLVAGVGTVLIVEGDAGMGKTRILDEAARLASQLSIRVGRGVADPGDTIVQLSPLMAALFDDPDPVLDRGSLGEGHAAPEQRYWLLQDIEALLERAALQGPLLVCLDDLQWADSGTAAALRTLPRRLAALPIGWIAAFRPDPRPAHFLDALHWLESNGAERIVLRPLDRISVGQATSDILLAEPDDALLDMTDRAGGSPFLLVELLTGLREEQMVRLESGRAQLIEARLPSRVSDSMRRRLERLSEGARQVATVAASLGRRFTPAEVAAMLNTPPSELLSAIDELLRAKLLIQLGDRLAFPHDLTLEAVRGSVPSSVRRSLDRQAAAALLASGALPVEVAMQLGASADPGDELAIVTLLKAAELLSPSDPGVASDLGLRALDLCPTRHPLRGPLVAGTAVWLHAAGRGTEAKVFADTAIREVLPAEQEATVRLSIAGMFSISPDTRAEASWAALRLPELPPDLRARHLGALLHNLVTSGRTDQAREILRGATKEVQESNDAVGRFAVEVAHSGLAYADGEFDLALQFVEAGVRSSLLTRDDTRGHVAREWRCEVLMMLDRFDEAFQQATDNIAEAGRDRQGWALHTHETGRARQLLQMGRLADAAAVLDERFTVDTAHEVVGVMDAAGVVAIGRIAIHRGDQTRARHAAEIAQMMMHQTAPSVRRHAVWLLAQLAMADGDAELAHRWLCADGRDGRMSILPRFPTDGADEVSLARIALNVDDAELVACACDSALARFERNPTVRSIAAAVAHTRGLVNRDPDDLAKAIELLESGQRPLALAEAIEDFGLLSVDSGAAAEGVAGFDRALSLFVRAGATWDAARLRGRLRALGVHRRLVATQRPRNGWDALTDSELEVARLAAQGFTNRETAQRLFVTHHTVSGHLRSIYLKLDIKSRVELSRVVRAHESDL